MHTILIGWSGDNLTTSNIKRERQQITRHPKGNILDPKPLTQLLPLCLHIMIEKKMWHKLSYACTIIINFSGDFLEDWGVGTFYLYTKVQLHRLINNRDHKHLLFLCHSWLWIHPLSLGLLFRSAYLFML